MWNISPVQDLCNVKKSSRCAHIKQPPPCFQPVYLGSRPKEIQATFRVEEESVRVGFIITYYSLERVDLEGEKRASVETAAGEKKKFIFI